MKTISVTAELIAQGQVKHPNRCPIALAFKATFPDRGEIYEVSDINQRVQVFNHDETYLLRTYSLTQKECDFIHAFDRGEEVKPFTFKAKLWKGKL